MQRKTILFKHNVKKTEKKQEVTVNKYFSEAEREREKKLSKKNRCFRNQLLSVKKFRKAVTKLSSNGNCFLNFLSAYEFLDFGYNQLKVSDLRICLEQETAVGFFLITRLSFVVNQQASSPLPLASSSHHVWLKYHYNINEQKVIDYKSNFHYTS